MKFFTELLRKQKEPEFKERVFALGENFNLFRTINEDPAIADTAHLKNYGPLTGFANSRISEKAQGLNQYAVSVEIDAHHHETKKTPDEPVTGLTGKNLVLWAQIGDKIFVASARENEENLPRKVVFDEWHDVTSIPKETVKPVVNQRQYQPLIVGRDDLKSLTFRFDYSTNL